MINQEPVPEGLLERALHTAFTTDEWPEWDNLDIVPTTEDPFDLDTFDPFAGEEDTDNTDAGALDSDSAGSGAEPVESSETDSTDTSDSPVLDYPDLGADLGSELGTDFSSGFDSNFDSGSNAGPDSGLSGDYDM